MIFGWIEWPDKATRDAVMGRMEEMSKSDGRINPEKIRCRSAACV